ncbi:MAG: hypothetical protein ACYC9O_01885 [Candidatus Latescibacterota bacterium]
MTGRKKRFLISFTVATAATCLLLGLSAAVFAQAKSGAAVSFTAADAKALKGSDPDAVGAVLSKLSQLHSAKGKDALKPAVDGLIECVWRELRLPPEQQWNLMDALKVISLTGDVRAKPLLLHVMSAIRGGGNPYTAQGLLLMGPGVVKDLADSLQSKSADTRGRAALTLDKIAQYDKSGKFFSAQDRTLIRGRLVANIKDANVGVRVSTVSALGTFGDASVVSALEQVEKRDAHKDSGGVYEVRVVATEALKKLKAK